jgi:hypothetical protein
MFARKVMASKFPLMPVLDCHDIHSTLASLAGAAGISPGELERVLRHYDEARFIDHSEEPRKRMPREVLARFGTDVERLTECFEGVYFFHATRVRDPGVFRTQGILSLPEMLEPIWRTLHELVPECSAEDWAEFRHSVEENGAGDYDGELYRHKTATGGLGAQLNRGPYGMLVREFFFRPEETTSHDYLGCPEIVQDIARCYESATGIDLEQRFCAATVPCIVKFRGCQMLAGAVESALWYPFAMLREGQATTNALWGSDDEGQPVPPERVVAVEVVA